MKALLRGLVASVLCFVATTGTAEDKAAGDEKAQKETYTVVKITKLNRTAEIKVLSRSELAEMKKKLKYEGMVIGQALKAAATEWSKADADGKKGPPFPISSPPPARVLNSLASFADSEKASAAETRENKKLDEAQAKIDKVVNARKSKLKEDKRAKLAEKELELESAYEKLQSKIEELAWAKETEASSAGDAAKKGGE